jgi:hypothetical protein
MRTTRAYGGLLLFVACAVGGCGGGVGGFGTGGDGGPGGPGSCGSHPCGNPGDDLVGDDEIPIDGGTPEDAAPPINPNCASGAPIGTGFACNAPGLVCPFGTISDCNGVSRMLDCSCDGSSWTCDPVPDLNCAPPVPCPDPSTLYPGSPCYGPEGQQCVSTEVPAPSCGGEPPPPVEGVCTCTTGGWSCPTTALPCPSQPPCPDPSSVYAGVGCSADGQTCPGNPQPCGMEVFYDAFQCEGSWVSVAATACDIGAFDASTGLILDASAPDAQ